ncbi:MAG: TolC family outer membrane protein [Sterolibacterium sp.]|nr:TolC family outer membrane protein [Sterolibacterium sp.]
MKKTRSLRLGIILGAAVFPFSALAADLLSVYRDAMSYDAQFSAARASRDAGLEKLPQAKAGLKPQINFTADTKWNDTSTRLRVSPTLSLGPYIGPFLGPFIPTQSSARYNTHSWGVSLAQPLFRWQNWATYKQAELSVATTEIQYSLAKQELIERVAQAYFDVLQAQEDVATADTQKTAIAEQLAAAKRNFEVGTATITDTHEAQARHDLVSASVIAAQNDLLVKKQVLMALIGKEPEELKGLKSGVQLAAPEPEDINQWVEAAGKDNLNVQLGKTAFEISNREFEKNRAGHMPTLDLVAQHGRQTNGNSALFGGTDTDATVVGLQLNIPIFSGGLTVSRTREAVALREKAKFDLDNVQRMAMLGARQAYLGVTSGLAQSKALEQALVSSQSALDSNKLGYEVGVRVNIDVLNAQQQVSSTRRDLAKARLQTLMGQLKLKAAIGTLNEQDIAAINGLLE